MTNKVARWVPLTGIVYVGAMLGVLLGPSSPDTTASGNTVIAWYEKHHTAVSVQTFLLAYAAVLGVMFFGSLCSYLRQRGAGQLTTVMFGGAVIQAVALGVGAGTSLALNDHTSRLTEGSAQTLNLINSDGFAILLFSGLSLTMLTAGIAILHTRALPVWLGWVTVVIGIGALTGVGSWFAFMATGLWILGVATVLIVQAHKSPQISLPDARTSTEKPAKATTRS
jgi:hypothetical protein